MRCVAAVIAGTLGLVVAPAARVAAGPTSWALTPGYEMIIPVTGKYGVALDAEAVMLNVTAVQPYGAGYLTAYPCGQPVPKASSLNYTAATVAVPNAVVARIGDGGSVCISTLRPVDIVVDVVGYFPAGSAIEPLTAPVRVLDTRSGKGAPAGRVAGRDTVELTLRGVAPIPDEAGTVVLNTTVAGAAAPGFLTVHPCDRARPKASNVNFDTGDFRPNLVVARLDRSGLTCLYTSAAADLVADAIAWFPAGATGFTAVPSPVRILDTRTGVGAPTRPLRAGIPLAVQVHGRAGVPDTATSVVVNLAATRQSGPGFVAAHPCGVTPKNSTVNFVAEPAIANLAIVGIDEAGDICLTSSTGVDVIADVAGYFTGTTDYVPTTPRRALDTRRRPVAPRCGMLTWRTGSTSFAVRDRAGVVRTVSSPVLANVGDAVIAPGCQGIMVGDDSGVVTELDLDGSVTTRLRLRMGIGGPANRLTVLADGRVVYMSYSGVYDVETSRKLVPAGSSYRPVGTLPDGKSAVFVSSTLLAFEFTVLEAGVTTDPVFIKLPVFHDDPTLSSSGSFMGFPVPVRAEGSLVYDVPVIADLNGVVLDVLEPEVIGRATVRWYTDDTAIVCSPGAVPRFWRIFNGATPIAGLPAGSCPYGG